MEWVGGTKEAVELIDELQKEGSLMNFYSKEVFERSGIQEILDGETLGDLIFNYGSTFLNHLLVGCYHSSNLNLLLNLFKPCKDYFDHCYVHKYYDTRPCFAIINLKTKSVCLMSIGNRKGHYYEDYFNLSMKHLDKSKEKFEEYDHAGIVNILRESLETIANVMNKLTYYEDDVSDEDLGEYEFQQEYLRKIFPNFSLECIQETFKPF
jgi:hypothetical protein